MKLCVIIPAYNEEKRIGKTLERYGRFLDKKTSKDFDYEILIVINNTHDKTEEVVKKYQKIFKKIKYIRFVDGGKGFAIIEGFKEALKSDFDLIGFVDADMATKPEEYFRLYKNIKNYDGVIASRWKTGAHHNYSIKRRIFSRGFNFVIRILLFLPYQDTQCGAKIFKRHVIKKIIYNLGFTAWAFDIDLLYQIKESKFNILEFPTKWEDKAGSNIDIIRDTIKMFASVSRLRLLNSPFLFIVRGYNMLPNKIKINHW